MEERATAHTELDAWRPEARMIADTVRLEEPLLALVKRRERPPQRVARRLRERCDAVRRVPGAADVEARRRIPQLTPEHGIVVHLGLADREARRRAFLSAVPEG